MRISDWSSDVCSSDLERFCVKRRREAGEGRGLRGREEAPGNGGEVPARAHRLEVDTHCPPPCDRQQRPILAVREIEAQVVPGAEIGRASCRERVCQYV